MPKLDHVKANSFSDDGLDHMLHAMQNLNDSLVEHYKQVTPYICQFGVPNNWKSNRCGNNSGWMQKTWLHHSRI